MIEICNENPRKYTYFLKTLFFISIPIAINSSKINIVQVDNVNIIGDFIMKLKNSNMKPFDKPICGKVE